MISYLGVSWCSTVVSLLVIAAYLPLLAILASTVDLEEKYKLIASSNTLLTVQAL